MLDLISTSGAICIQPDGSIRTDVPRPAALLPGSFNPLHRGHTALAVAAAARLGFAVDFELSIANVDKPELAAEEMARRAGQFAGAGRLWLTRAPTFIEKAALFPGTAFVVGVDTAARLVDPKYYRGDPDLRDEALRKLCDLGCRVIVAGRVDPDGRFRTWEAGAVAAFSSLFVPLTEADFRVDVSSTALREAAFSQ